MIVVGLLQLRVTHAAPEPMERSTRSAAGAFARDVYGLTRHRDLRQRSAGIPRAVGALGRRARYTSYPHLIETIRSRRGPQRTALQLSRAVGAGRGVSEALRHLDAHGSEPDGAIVADALARFLVARCESRHAGWRVVRQVVVDSAADAPWEKCARRAIPAVSEDLLRISAEDGHTRLVRVQHAAAKRRAEQLAAYVDHAAVLAELGLDARAVSTDRWADALSNAVSARSREQVARAVDAALRD